MRRNHQLIQAILEYVEQEHNSDPIPVPELDGYTSTEIKYHVLLCKDAGYLITDASNQFGTLRVDAIFRLTWVGHEALDAYRD